MTEPSASPVVFLMLNEQCRVCLTEPSPVVFLMLNVERTVCLTEPSPVPAPASRHPGVPTPVSRDPTRDAPMAPVYIYILYEYDPHAARARPTNYQGPQRGRGRGELGSGVTATVCMYIVPYCDYTVLTTVLTTV